MWNATLVKLEGADHSFKAGKNDVMSLLVNDIAIPSSKGIAPGAPIGCEWDEF